MAVAAATRPRVCEDIVRLVHRGAGLDELPRNVNRTLRRAVPAASLSGVTTGDLDRSLRQRQVRAPYTNRRAGLNPDGPHRGDQTRL
jgi:hypothetical protein